MRPYGESCKCTPVIHRLTMCCAITRGGQFDTCAPNTQTFVQKFEGEVALIEADLPRTLNQLNSNSSRRENRTRRTAKRYCVWRHYQSPPPSPTTTSWRNYSEVVLGLVRVAKTAIQSVCQSLVTGSFTLVRRQVNTALGWIFFIYLFFANCV